MARTRAFIGLGLVVGTILLGTLVEGAGGWTIATLFGRLIGPGGGTGPLGIQGGAIGGGRGLASWQSPPKSSLAPVLLLLLCWMDIRFPSLLLALYVITIPRQKMALLQLVCPCLFVLRAISHLHTLGVAQMTVLNAPARAPLLVPW